MSERFYRQQMDYFNIKSVAELGQFHRGEITKRGKRTPTTKAAVKAKPPKILKSDLIDMINEHFETSLLTSDYQGLTAVHLSDLLSAVRYMSENYQGLVAPALTVELGRLKKPYCKEVRDLLGIPECFTLDVSKMTVLALKKLIKQLCIGMHNNEQ